MCDPVMLSVASTVVGAVGSVGSSMAQQSAQKKQQKEVEIWQQQQKRDRAAEQVRQEGLRQEATAAQQKGVEDLSGEEQVKRQKAEEERLASYLQGEGEGAQATPETDMGPQATADTAMFSGQQGGDTITKTDLAKKINEAGAGASDRIKALAKVSSYGESFGGLGTDNPILQQKAGEGIDMANEFRRGSLGAFGVEKAVDPVQVSFTPSPMANLFSTALSLGAQGMGGQFGTGAAATEVNTGPHWFNKPNAGPHWFKPAEPHWFKPTASGF